MEFLAAPGARDKALWPLEHHEYQQGAVDQQLERLELVEQAGLPGPTKDADQHERTHEYTCDIAHSTHDHDNQDDYRDKDHKAVREHRTDLCHEDRTTERGQHGAHNESQKLGVDGVDPHRLGDLLILADCHPGPPET